MSPPPTGLPDGLFTGLIAFPPTPAGADGIVDTTTLARLIDRLATAGITRIAVLGSTGIYAYLDRRERNRAVAASVEAAAGRASIIAGIAALRTDHAQDFARHAERAGAAGLLLAPMSYTPLTQNEAALHYRAAAAATGLPLCIYDNPSTTGFTFSDPLIADLASIPTIAAMKMPAATDGSVAATLARIRAIVPNEFHLGTSVDWAAADALLAGSAAWYSVAAGLLPTPALHLTQAAQSGNTAEANRLDAAFQPLWTLFRQHGSLRIAYEIAAQLDLPIGNPPLPLRCIDAQARPAVAAALAGLPSPPR